VGTKAEWEGKVGKLFMLFLTNQSLLPGSLSSSFGVSPPRDASLCLLPIPDQIAAENEAYVQPWVVLGNVENLVPGPRLEKTNFRVE